MILFVRRFFFVQMCIRDRGATCETKCYTNYTRNFNPYTSYEVQGLSLIHISITAANGKTYNFVDSATYPGEPNSIPTLLAVYGITSSGRDYDTLQTLSLIHIS